MGIPQHDIRGNLGSGGVAPNSSDHSNSSGGHGARPSLNPSVGRVSAGIVKRALEGRRGMQVRHDVAEEFHVSGQPLGQKIRIATGEMKTILEKEIDINRDGVITQAELNRAMDTRHPRISPLQQHPQ